MSPAEVFAMLESVGKDNTSVGTSFPRNRRFRDCISRLPVISTLTSPCTPEAAAALAVKRLNAVLLNPGTFFFRMITFRPSSELFLKQNRRAQIQAPS